MVIAAEDIGLAYPQGIVVTKACVDAALQLGLPEARLPLAEAAVLLATAPKSNSAHNAIIAAMSDIQNGAVEEIPRHLKNVHADSAGSARPDAYKYPHNYHPCGSRRWQVLRVGMDIKLRCLGCGHEVMQPRRKVEKMIKRIVPKEE